MLREWFDENNIQAKCGMCRFWESGVGKISPIGNCGDGVITRIILSLSIQRKMKSYSLLFRLYEKNKNSI